VPSADFQVQRIREAFRRKFGTQTRPCIIRSPGRVNLIGEHTDYNEGFVLPAAIDKAIIFAVAPRNDYRFHFISVDLEDGLKGDVRSPQKSSKGWPNYLLGVIDQLQRRGYRPGGINLAFGGDIPIGAGLSSSAAMEGGFIFALNEIFSLGIDKISMAKIAQKAEHEFAGVQCGIMDQFANMFGENRKVLKIDCRSLEYTHIPFERDDLKIILCETPTRRSLASSEYNIRRTQCEAGIAILQGHDSRIKSLRDVSLEFLFQHGNGMESVVAKRCEYVIRENARVLQACEDLMRSDLASFGRKMFESHAGLRDDYEVSSSELDILVDLASGIDGVLGSRMMGAGFGGCTINLVEESSAKNFVEVIGSRFRERTGNAIKVHITKLVGGTERACQ
jgi:galactokinase